MTDLNLYQVRIPKAGEHPSNEWAEYQANPSSFYPAVVPGLVWWALNYLIEKPEWAAEIKSHNWPTNYAPNPVPTPAPEPLTMPERMDRAEALFRAHGWL